MNELYHEKKHNKMQELFMLDVNSKDTGGTRANWLRPGALGIFKYFFSNKVINRWNSLDQRTVDASSINVFKSRLIYIRDNRMGFFMD